MFWSKKTPEKKQKQEEERLARQNAKRQKDEESAARQMKALELIFHATAPKSVVSENGVTVSYILDSLEALNAEAAERDGLLQRTDSKIREILRNNRDSDLALHAETLGIVIKTIERAAKPPSDTKRPPELWT